MAVLSELLVLTFESDKSAKEPASNLGDDDDDDDDDDNGNDDDDDESTARPEDHVDTNMPN
ncbi:hypothetical protein HK405_014255, partial [Cladochytrium tenue]